MCCSHPHSYAKLRPEAASSAQLLEEGEGSLHLQNAAQDEKRSPRDFALWKRSKPEEESAGSYWESDWGRGRPGWHIECSVMSSEAFSQISDGLLDIHAGGVDLKFPHHDNEIAQSEAYLDNTQWCNYWFHTGHLHIDGAKMSKSLKNFITIREALKRYSWKEIRLTFLMHKYTAPMDYGDDNVEHAITVP